MHQSFFTIFQITLVVYVQSQKYMLKGNEDEDFEVYLSF